MEKSSTTDPVREMSDADILWHMRHIEPHLKDVDVAANILVQGVRKVLTKAALSQQPAAPAQAAPYAWATPGGDVSRSWFWCNERCLPGQKPRPLVYGDTAPQPAQESDHG